ncbi:MAG TPA: tautomerase family protein [Limnochordales bacterium]
MVMVRVHMLAGRSSEQKAELIARVTAAVAETLSIQPGDVRVLLLEIPPDAWGIAGQPASVVRGTGAG